ncbi:hypothetical protein A2707_02265 [Candidatus Saccharibacteria bacterium RIFCSPHIGHO2_01_FULL_45_15]|nr:MAG: hypothetical protein A2707_02265 [Candidatus Saccharibacteria bacterium RIFCSPHIGHO2_01_FULL_45_15]OGL28730.1 MAG: hypothetical protein A3C39_00100 [Candidatus Saccharibacteria bacterium RIFCSPHIGHO2_02_FULL_46_12]OGL32569.1 MAG: hypothetical protein A3E76_06455 [Candidatus Saccharibacteria bacterium RIFCSPHIGHO2_12_FULL_44_22]
MLESFAEILAVGGKSNSLGRTNEVIERVLDDKYRLDELYTCVFNDDAWVRMRAMDAIEKICRQHPDWLLPYIDRFQRDLALSDQPSVQWHLAQIYGQVDLNAAQKHVAIQWLKDRLSTTAVDWIVAANAMTTLVQFTNDGSVPKDTTVSLLELQQTHRSKSVVRKAKKLLLGLMQ